MRRLAPVLTLIGALAVVGGLSSVVHADDCFYNPIGALICTPGGTIPGPPGTDPPRERPPIRYIYETTRPVIGVCHYWSRTPGGVDAWDPANDPEVIRIVTTTPECPSLREPVSDTAWRIFRAFPLAEPAPALEPPVSGITGLPTYLASPDPVDISHSEVLPDGRRMDVEANVIALVIDWGDGAESAYDSADARPHPAGSVTHTYVTKTCDAAYREEHPSGGNCHPTLEAYPITATYTWLGRYRIGGGWIDLGTLDRTVTVNYDVDEVQGVLQP